MSHYGHIATNKPATKPAPDALGMPANRVIVAVNARLLKLKKHPVLKRETRTLRKRPATPPLLSSQAQRQ
jgi:hypothetical protein